MTLLLIVVIDGSIKTEAPGSLAHPMPTHVLPPDWTKMPIAFGLISASHRDHAARKQLTIRHSGWRGSSQRQSGGASLTDPAVRGPCRHALARS